MFLVHIVAEMETVSDEFQLGLDRLAKWTACHGMYLPVPVALQDQPGDVGQFAPNFAAHAFDSGNRHLVVGGGPVPHPGDDGSLGSFFDRNAFCARHSPASDWGRVSGDLIGQIDSQVVIRRRKVQKLQYRKGKLTDVLFLFFLPAPKIGPPAPGVLRRGPFLLQRLLGRRDVLGWRP